MAKKETLNLLMSSIVVGVGLASGQPIIAALLGGIGINWTSEIIWSAWQQVRDQWFGTNGVLGDEVAQALDRALAKTISLPSLIEEFKTTSNYEALSPTEMQAVKRTPSFVKKNLTHPFSTSKFNINMLDDLNSSFIVPIALQEQLNEYLAAFLSENKVPEVLIEFLQNRLDLDRLTFHFVEDIKQNTHLWRSQQLLFAQSYLSSLSRLEQGQTEILNRLDAFISNRELNNYQEAKDYSPLPEFSNESLLQQAIAKLLTFIPDITDVRILQRGSQKGKDIVFMGNGPLGDRVNCACVVKNIAISGEVGVNSGARTVLQQITQSLDTPYTDHNGSGVQVQRVYIVSPYEISQEAIESVRGALQRMAGQVTFLGGTELFRLFRNHWPDFFIDEASALEVYVEQMKQNIDSDNAIEAVAAFYRLGYVSESEKRIYVPLNFMIKLCSYTIAVPLSDLLPSQEDISKKWARKDINQSLRAIKQLAYFVNHLSAWGFWDDQVQDQDRKTSENRKPMVKPTESLLQSLDELSEALSSSWDTAARKQVGRQDTNSVPKFAPEVKLNLANRKALANKLRLVEALVHSGIRHLRNDLQKFSKLVRSTPDDEYILNGDSLEVKKILSLQVCIEALRSQYFLSNQQHAIYLPKNLLTVFPTHFLIVGPPGSGKSTFCRWNALQDAEALATEESKVIPVYIPLHRLEYKDNWNLEEHILSRTGKSALIGDEARGRFETGGAILRIYFDGLDEIAKSEVRNFVIRQIRAFCESRSRVQAIVTSREYVRFPDLSWFYRVSLAGLSETDITSLVEQWLSSAPGLVHDFYTQINENPILKSLMSTPLLATLILLVFKHTHRLPSSRTRLYAVFIELLCGGWDQAKNLPRDQRFGSDIKLMVLTELAGVNHLKGIREFGRSELRTATRRILREIDNRKLNVLLSELIEDGVITGGLGKFEFSHFSFQEYLAARFLAGDPSATQARKALKSFAVERDDWWREPLRFYAGLMEPRSFTQWIVKEFSRFGIPSSDSEELFETIAEAYPSFNLRAYITTEPK